MKSVILTSDWHICDGEDAKRIDKLFPKSIPLILMGDLIDAGLNRGMQWDQDNITKQVKYLQMILKHRKVLGYVLGNHEARIVRATGLNPYLTLLGEPKSEYEIIFKDTERFKKYRKIVVEHGTRNAQNPLTQLRSFAQIHPDADILALGHDHSLGIWRDRDQWLVRTGHLLPYPEYARKAILPKKPMGYIKYHIKNNTLEIILA